MRSHSITYLKVKIKSLAEEARIIKKEEARAKLRCRSNFVRKSGQSSHYSSLRQGLYEHRILVVRRAARETQLVYGFLRGRKYKQLEPKCHTPLEFCISEGNMKNMLTKYGNVKRQGWSTEAKAQYESDLADQWKAFKDWLKSE